MLLVDTLEKTISRDEELKKNIAISRPHGEWWKKHVTLEDLRKANRSVIDTKRKPIFLKPTETMEVDDTVLEKLWSGDRR